MMVIDKDICRNLLIRENGQKQAKVSQRKKKQKHALNKKAAFD